MLVLRMMSQNIYPMVIEVTLNNNWNLIGVQLVVVRMALALAVEHTAFEELLVVVVHMALALALEVERTAFALVVEHMALALEVEHTAFALVVEHMAFEAL